MIDIETQEEEEDLVDADNYGDDVSDDVMEEPLTPPRDPSLIRPPCSNLNDLNYGPAFGDGRLSPPTVVVEQSADDTSASATATTTSTNTWSSDSVSSLTSSSRVSHLFDVFKTS